MVILILISVIAGVGAILYVHHRIVYGKDPQPEPQPAPEQEVCCGLHITCEKGLPKGTEIVYYDDEELDIFAHRPADSYTESETEQFRDVLLTLLPTDIAGWAHSLELREITLPEAVREELMLIISEERLKQPSI